MEYLTSENLEEVITFIKNNINKSLFIYGSLNKENTVLKFKKVNNKIIGLYLISNNKYISYLFDDIILQTDILEIVNDAQNIEHLEGTVVNPEIEIFSNFYTFKTDHGSENEIAYLLPNKMESSTLAIELLDIHNKEDVKEYIAASLLVDFNYDETSFVRDYKDAKIYILKNQEGKIISSATLTSISDLTAVIVGVFTLKEYRNQGLATELVKYLIANNMTDKRTFFIFFNNPKAKSIYLNIGFKINNTMSMIYKK